MSSCCLLLLFFFLMMCTPFRWTSSWSTLFVCPWGPPLVSRMVLPISFICLSRSSSSSQFAVSSLFAICLDLAARPRRFMNSLLGFWLRPAIVHVIRIEVAVDGAPSFCLLGAHLRRALLFRNSLLVFSVMTIFRFRKCPKKTNIGDKVRDI